MRLRVGSCDLGVLSREEAQLEVAHDQGGRRRQGSGEHVQLGQAREQRRPRLVRARARGRARARVNPKPRARVRGGLNLDLDLALGGRRLECHRGEHGRALCWQPNGRAQDRLGWWGHG